MAQKSNSSKNNKTLQKKVSKKKVVKPRFYILCVILVLVLATAGYFGVKALIGSPDEKGSDGDQQSNASQQNGDQDAPQDGGGEDGINSSDPDGSALLVDTTVYENSIYNAVLGSYYISVIGKTKAYVTEQFGPIVRYEDWSGGIYFHKQFPGTMYVGYSGGIDENGAPTDISMCTAVEIALTKIISEVEPFTPISWGNIDKDDTGQGWTDYSYTTAFGAGYTMTVFCNQEGEVQSDTHILVKTR